MISRSLNKYLSIISVILEGGMIEFEYPRVSETVPYSIIPGNKIFLLCKNGQIRYRIVTFNNGNVIYNQLFYVPSIMGGFEISEEDYNNFIKAMELFYDKYK